MGDEEARMGIKRKYSDVEPSGTMWASSPTRRRKSVFVYSPCLQQNRNYVVIGGTPPGEKRNGVAAYEEKENPFRPVGAFVRR